MNARSHNLHIRNGRLAIRLAAARAQAGAYMIELILALAASGVLATALVASMAETERFGSAGQNQILAFSIAQEQIDTARNMAFDDLAALIGSHTLKVYEPDPVYMGCPTDGATCRLNPRALLADFNALDWPYTEVSSSNRRENKFVGSVQESVEVGPQPNTLRVTVVVSWEESGATRSYTLSTLVSRNGINNG